MAWQDDPVVDGPPSFGANDPVVESRASPLVEGLHALTGSMIEGVPVVGPSLRSGADYLGSAIRSLISGNPVEQEREFVRGESQRIAQERPLTSAAGQMIGSVASTAPLVAAAPAAFGVAPGMGLLSRMAAGGASGGAIGAADAYARGNDPVTGGALGGALGAGSAAVAASIGRFTARLLGKKPPATPSASELENQSSALYNQARKVGLRIKPDAYSNIVDDVEAAAHKAGFDVDANKELLGTLAALKRRAAEGVKQGGVHLDQIEVTRQMIRDAGKTAKDSRIAAIMRERFDELAEALPDTAVIGGDKSALTEILPQARSLWHRMNKVEIVERAIQQAEDLAGGPTKLLTALKSKFRVVANRADFAKKFNPKEQEAIRAVIKADNKEVAVQRLTSLGAMLGWGQGVGGAGAALGGLLGGLPGAAVGYGVGNMAAQAGIGATRGLLGRAAAQRALEAQHLIATGSPLLPLPPQPAIMSLIPSLGIGAKEAIEDLKR